MRRHISMLVLVASLAACSGRPSEDDAAARAAAATPPPRQKTVFDEQLKALDKAKAVQQTVDEAAKAQRDAIDAAERPAPPADDKGG